MAAPTRIKTWASGEVLTAADLNAEFNNLINTYDQGIKTTDANQHITYEAEHTAPTVTLHNTTHEDTEGGREGQILFKGEQSGGEETTIAKIQGSHDGTSDDQKGDLILYTNDGSDSDTPTEAMRIDSGGDTTLAGELSIADSKFITKGSDAGAKYKIGWDAGSFVAAADHDAYMLIDSNDDATTRFFAVAKDNVSPGSASILFKVDEDGDATLIGELSILDSKFITRGTDAGNIYRVGWDGGSFVATADHDAYVIIDSNNDSTTRFFAVAKDNVSPGSSTVLLKVLESGNVGINEAAPDSKLEVNGTIHATNLDGGAINLTANASGQIIRDPSDSRLKENVVAITGATAKVKALAAKEFNFKAKAGMGTQKQYGFVAQEAEAVDSKFAKTADRPTRLSESFMIEGMKSVDQPALIAILWQTVKELEARIATLEAA